MNMKKRLLCILTAGALCFTLSACGLLGDGYQNTVAGDETSLPAAQSVRLTVFTLFEDMEYKALVDEFAAQNTNITVSDRSQGYSDAAAETLALMLQSDDPPDVVFYHTGEGAQAFIEQGLFVPLDEIRQTYPDYAEGILPVAISSAAGQGDAYAVPVRGFYEGLYVHTELFTQVNLPLPTTFDELLKVVETFADSGIVPIAASLSQTPHYLLDHLMLAQGGTSEFLAVPATAQQVPQSWYTAQDRLKALYEKGAFGKDADMISDAQATELFLNKQAAMRVDGSWLTARMEDEGTDSDVEVMSFPGVLEGELVGGFSSGFFITRSTWEDTAKRGAAVAFVNALTDPAAVARLCGARHLPAARISAQNGTALARSAEKLTSGMRFITLPVDARLPQDTWRTVTDKTLAIASGKADVREVYEAAFS